MKRILFIAAMLALVTGSASAQIISGSGKGGPGGGSWKPGGECKLGHAAAADQLKRDLEYVLERYKNDPKESDYQRGQIGKQMDLLEKKRIVCGCKKGALPELPSGNPGTGGGPPVVVPVDPAKVKALLKDFCGKDLTDEQVALYLAMKREAATLMTKTQLQHLERKYGWKINPASLDAMNDEQFIESIRLSREAYYLTTGGQRDKAALRLIQTNGYQRLGKTQNVDGLQLVQVTHAGQEQPKMRRGQPQIPGSGSAGEMLMQPTGLIGVEFWPMFYGSADKLFESRK